MSNEGFAVCKNCIYPSTKPDLEFDKNGVCQGCNAYSNRKKINWSKKEGLLKKILFKHKKNSKGNYDCIIPVSGGKDSHYQVIKILEYGLNPLCVNARTDKLSAIGRENLNSLERLGVDLIEVSTDPALRRRINKFTLETIGDISWAEHITIFTVPFRIACDFNIPLIIWGENPQNENGGPKIHEKAINLDRKWLEEFGGLLGFRPSDLENLLRIDKKKLIQYTFPSSKIINKKKIKGLFLGQFLAWDGHANAISANKRGFKFFKKNVEGSIVNYENLDNVQMRIHDYFKYLKYGYDRVTDWCCWNIRRKRLTRKNSIKINKNKSGKFPNSYLGISLNEILKEINCSRKEFIQICDNFTNKNIFKTNKKNQLIKNKDGSPILKYKIV